MNNKAAKQEKKAMTVRKEQSLRNKIENIRKALAADKKTWGGTHHDGRGLRYSPPSLFIQLRDYNGGLRYLRWFDRTFPDDMGYPIFLFEWTFILHETGNLKEAERKAYQTFHGNNYIFDKFLGKDLVPHTAQPSSNWATVNLAESLSYTSTSSQFTSFTLWLENFINSEKFITFRNEVLRINQLLDHEPAGKTRSELVHRLMRLRDGG